MTLKVLTSKATPTELRQPSGSQIGRGDRGYLLHSCPTFLLCYILTHAVTYIIALQNCIFSVFVTKT
jgi:hypothetical protein